MLRKTVIIAYIPVLHEGYRRLIENHPETEVIYIMGPDLISEFPHLAKEIRALSPELIKKSLESWQIIGAVEILNQDYLKKLAEEKTPVIVAQEDVTLELIDKYLPENPVAFENIFLRWDRHNSTQEFAPSPDQTITSEDFHRHMISEAKEEAQKSSDWWRQIGALAIKEGKVILKSHNTHLPTPHTPYIDGDPRNNFHKGINLELSTAIHAEARLIAEAAQRGVSLQGTDFYVTTFPCPPCAKLIAYCGAQRLFFTEGYGVLDGERVLKDKNVKIIQIKQG